MPQLQPQPYIIFISERSLLRINSSESLQLFFPTEPPKHQSSFLPSFLFFFSNLFFKFIFQPLTAWTLVPLPSPVCSNHETSVTEVSHGSFCLDILAQVCSSHLGKSNQLSNLTQTQSCLLPHSLHPPLPLISSLCGQPGT